MNIYPTLVCHSITSKMAYMSSSGFGIILRNSSLVENIKSITPFKLSSREMSACFSLIVMSSAFMLFVERSDLLNWSMSPSRVRGYSESFL